MGVHSLRRVLVIIFSVQSTVVGANKWVTKGIVPLFLKLIIRPSGRYREMNRP